MLKLLKKHMWILELIPLVLCVALLAQGTSRVLGVWGGNSIHDKIETRQLPQTPVESPPSMVIQGTSHAVTAIVTRNVFCSSCAVAKLTSENRSEGAGSVNDKLSLPANLRLIATLVCPQHSDWSFAVIQNTQIEQTALYPINAQVTGELALKEIFNNHVLLGNSLGTVHLDLAEASEEVAAIRKNTETSLMSKSAGRTFKGIRRTGEGQYEIQQATLNRLLSNPVLIGQSGLVSPSVGADGKPNGFRISRIRPGSFYALLGLENGDTIHAVNGHLLTTVDAVLPMYTKLRSSKHVSISLKRRGKKITQDYIIR